MLPKFHLVLRDRILTTLWFTAQQKLNFELLFHTLVDFLEIKILDTVCIRVILVGQAYRNKE